MRRKQKRQVVHFGEDALADIEGILDSLKARSVFLVADEQAYRASGAQDELESLLDTRNVDKFVGFELNPKLGDIERGIHQFQSSRPDVVLAVGGGTAIDLAKLIGSLAGHKIPARDLITGRSSIEKAGPPLIAVPTTAGTGSEATHFAVAYVDQKKQSVAHPCLLPDHAIVDPRLTYSLPTHVTSASGLDAFCQSVESIWAVGATDESLGHATRSVRLALKHLAAAVQHGTPEARRKMCEAAHLSGKAINISKTTAPHAISYAMTTRYGVPHGIAVALTLAPMLQHNATITDSDCSDPRGAGAVRRRIALILELLDAKSPEHGARNIQALMEKIGVPLRLSDVGVRGEEAIRWLAKEVNVERLSNNPRTMATETIENLLKNIG